MKPRAMIALSAIAMCSRVLLDSPPAAAADRRELATNIYDSTTWMSRMIQDLLDVSTIEAGVLSIVRANEKVELILRRASDLFTRAAAERKVGIVVQVDDAEPLGADGSRCGCEDGVAVGAAVTERLAHRVERLGVSKLPPGKGDHAVDAAHQGPGRRLLAGGGLRVRPRA